jgi:uncharacterized protein
MFVESGSGETNFRADSKKRIFRSTGAGLLTALLIGGVPVGAAAPGNETTEKSTPAEVDMTKAVDPEKKVLIRELIKLMNVDKTMHEVVNQMFAMQKAMVLRSVESSAMSPEKQKSIEDAMSRASTRFSEALFDEIKLPAYVDDVYIEVYSKYYSASELKDLIAFYKSPTGMKFINLTPEVAKDSMVIFQERMLPKIQSMSAQILKEEFEDERNEAQSEAEDKGSN